MPLSCNREIRRKRRVAGGKMSESKKKKLRQAAIALGALGIAYGARKLPYYQNRMNIGYHVSSH